MKRIDTYRDSVWCDPTLTAHEKLVLLAYSRTMDHDTLGGAHPGDALVAFWTGLHRKTVWRLRGKLTTAGWLVQTHRGGSPKGGRRLASVYRGNIPDHLGSRHDPPRGAPSQRPRLPAWRTSDPPRGATPPSQGPADVAATAGAASTPAQRTSRSNGQTPNGCPYCHDLPISPPCTECQPRQEAATA